MKYTATEAEKILEKLIASTRSPRGRFSAEKSYALLKKRLPQKEQRMLSMRKVRVFAIAATVALFCTMGWVVYEYMLPVGLYTISTLTECKNVKLPDGTEVTLNHFSSLTYPERFRGKHRKVTLKGEGYFEVSKSKEHPFIVQAEAVKVRVLGTHFNIEAYPGDPEVKTTLFVQEIVRELSNSFGVKIKIENKKLRNYRLTAKFTDGESLEDILYLLQQGRDFKYKQTDKGITIN